jgi:benzaldehyde dehydrogenase (NAD)
MFMSANTTQMLDENTWHGRVFSGGWITLGDSIEVHEPATGQTISRVGVANADDVSTAAKRANEAQPRWSATSCENRADVLRDAAKLAENHSSEIISWIVRESGSTKAKAGFELQITIRALHEAAAMASQTNGILLPSRPERFSYALRIPMGVVGVISPFNFPLYLSMRAIAPALATGNAVVLKPDPRTPISGGFTIARLFEEAGLMSDVLHVLPGGKEVGARLCEDPSLSMIQFTGSTSTGRLVNEIAGRHLKRVSLELGGKNALIILDGVDVEVAASNVAWGAFLHSGQICMSAGKILVQREIAEYFTERLVERANSLSVGDPASEEVMLGPMIDEAQLLHTHAIVERSIEQGATLKAGGTFKELFYAPTVLGNVSTEMLAYQEEIFGPVAPITIFDDDDEAIRLANQTVYGLSAGVLGPAHRAMNIGSKLRSGIVHVNDQTVADDVINPFGGLGASGNGSSIGGPANWEAFTQWRWVTLAEKPHAYPF